MPKAGEEKVSVRREMPAPIFSLGGTIATRTAEAGSLYQGEPEAVPEIVAYIFPYINFAQLSPTEVYEQLRLANTRLRSLKLDAFDRTTATTVASTLSMGYRTRHPLAFNRLETEIKQTLKGVRVKNGGRVGIIDVGYGPGTISMAVYELAQRQGYNPELIGIDLSPVHQAIATTLYPPSLSRRVDWQVGNATNLADLPAGEFCLGTAFDVGHHLALAEYRQMVENLLAKSEQVIISDPTNNRLAQRVVAGITAKDKVHQEAVDSYRAAYSRADLAAMYGEIVSSNGNQGRLVATLTDTGFMHIARLRRD